MVRSIRDTTIVNTLNKQYQILDQKLMIRITALAMSECAVYITIIHVYKSLPICELSSTFTYSKTLRD